MTCLLESPAILVLSGRDKEIEQMADIKNIFNQVINEQTDKDTIAKLEIAREYFTNPDFKAKLEEYTWRVNNSK